MMRFRIKRASRSGQPCGGAYQLPGKTGEYDDWFIDLNSLDELLGTVIIAGSDFVIAPHSGIAPGSPPMLTIYDDYLE